MKTPKDFSGFCGLRWRCLNINKKCCDVLADECEHFKEPTQKIKGDEE